jgi:hypothetical protein
MQGATVGLYCAVVDRFDPPVHARAAAACEMQAAFNWRSEMPCHAHR